MLVFDRQTDLTPSFELRPFQLSTFCFFSFLFLLLLRCYLPILLALKPEGYFARLCIYFALFSKVLVILISIFLAQLFS